MSDISKDLKSPRLIFTIPEDCYRDERITYLQIDPDCNQAKAIDLSQRIITCVNACAGTSTAELEALIPRPTEGHSTLRKLYPVWRRLKDRGLI